LIPVIFLGINSSFKWAVGSCFCFFVVAKKNKKEKKIGLIATQKTMGGHKIPSHKT
jgi:hypothetical protein